jgi:hypothetical protein
MGRSSGQFIRFINFVSMQMNWKYAAPIAVVVIALAAVVLMNSAASPTDVASNTPKVEQTPAAPQGETTMAAKGVAEPSGNVDDLVASLVGEANQDLTFSTAADEDMALVTKDSASINGYLTAYDETTF